MFLECQILFLKNYKKKSGLCSSPRNTGACSDDKDIKAVVADVSGEREFFDRGIQHQDHQLLGIAPESAVTAIKLI